MSPCDVKHLIRWAVAALIMGAVLTTGILYYSDRMTHETTIQAHDIVVQNHNEIRFLEAQVDQMRQELKACIEKRTRQVF